MDEPSEDPLQSLTLRVERLERIIDAWTKSKLETLEKLNKLKLSSAPGAN